MRWGEIIGVVLVTAMAAVPASAQDHGLHHGHDLSASDQKTPDPHAVHNMPEPSSGPVDGTDQSAMAFEQATETSPGPMMEMPAPPEAGSGPPRAADAIWGADAMLASRRALQAMHGDYPLFWFQADRAEIQVRDGTDAFLWDMQGFYGGTTSRFWFKSEGEGHIGKRIDDAELQVLYSRAIAPFFDVQAGVRQDVKGEKTTYAVLGIQGLAPYMFELDTAFFLSHRGDLTARIEAELDQRITQRLILQPRAELDLAAQDVPQLGLGAGIDTIELGVRLRYEIVREFAPYIGIEQSRRVGRGADIARAACEDPSVTNFVIGTRFWF